MPSCIPALPPEHRPGFRLACDDQRIRTRRDLVEFQVHVLLLDGLFTTAILQDQIGLQQDLGRTTGRQTRGVDGNRRAMAPGVNFRLERTVGGLEPRRRGHPVAVPFASGFVVEQVGVLVISEPCDPAVLGLDALDQPIRIFHEEGERGAIAHLAREPESTSAGESGGSIDLRRLRLDDLNAKQRDPWKALDVLHLLGRWLCFSTGLGCLGCR